MAEAKIVYKDNKGFWIAEDAMELAFQYIYTELKTGNYHFSMMENLLYDCEVVINGWNRSYLTLTWKYDLPNSEDEQEMIFLLENIIVKLQNKGEYISIEELQSFTPEATDWKNFWSKPFRTINLLNIFDALIKTLKGEWDSTNYEVV